MGINKDLGLPFGDGMEKIAFAFDVDGTLIDSAEGEVDWPYSSTLTLVRAMAQQNWKNVDIIIWSGGGARYAETQARQWLKDVVGLKFHSKLEYAELRKRYHKIIAVDDIQDTRLGDANLIVRNK